MRSALFLYVVTKFSYLGKNINVLNLIKEVNLMQEIFMALVAGLIVGFIFALLRLPIPAPPVLSGLIGIIGIFLGYKAFQMLLTIIAK